MKYFVMLITLLGISWEARAGILLDIGGTYISETMTASTNTSSTKYLYNVGVLFNLSKTVWGGWSYLGVSHSDTIPGTTTSYASMDTGPTLKWQFGKSQNWSLSGTFNLVSRGVYSSGSAAQEKWEGMSYLVSLGYLPEVSTDLHIGVSINYFGANYTKKTVNNTESSVSNSKTWIFPMISLTKAW
ncbi:hypothetical protein [Bdellovibrio svalbardensis]|uniref:Outer membrane protein beta-barrel domain-containing protein n=1 Tax=Bdellovibrio svalbardensis TaxID=2972972 RepID=A0ABT6DM03_9BACT|nr:hypothetical protein [Bdellovibrio svalbardensis]MDG0817905.1 hypothetical protein [Bdellovibrio svalbardensis]